LGDYIHGAGPGEGDANRLQGGISPGSYLNPKDNFIIAVGTLCIPGIIGGLDRYRQIQCQYISCLEDSVNTGLPQDACDKLKSYETCKYIVGEIFQLVPFVALFDLLINALKAALSDPFALLGLALGIFCTLLCNNIIADSGISHDICFWGKILNTIGEVIQLVTNIIDSDAWSPPGDYCAQLV